MKSLKYLKTNEYCYYIEDDKGYRQKWITLNSTEREPILLNNQFKSSFQCNKFALDSKHTF